MLEIFSVRLKWARERKGLTQKAMSEKLNMSQQGYGKIELNQREPNLDTLVKIRTILDESTEFLLGIEALDRFSKITYGQFQNSYSRYLSFQRELTEELQSKETSEYRELRKKYLQGVIVGNYNAMISRHEKAMEYIRAIPCITEELIAEYMEYKAISVFDI